MTISPPEGTAIVRPRQHVHAVRERHLEQLAGSSLAGSSRSARAWEWALGETDIGPVTGRITSVPPSRVDIEAEIAEADERRLRGDREGRADGAAAVLRWLIGDDDHLPVRGPNRGELVGGFAEVIRSPGEIAELIGALSRHDGPAEREFRQGAIAMLTWVVDRNVGAPVTGARTRELTTAHLKSERLHAEDLIQQGIAPASAPVMTQPGHSYGFGVARTIAWLLGDIRNVHVLAEGTVR
jgi:hypothetical protein